MAGAGKQAIAEAEALFLSIGEGAIVTDASGKVSRINQTGLTILGIKAEDILGKWYPDAVIAETEAGAVLSYMERPITEMFMTGKAVFSKLYFRKPAGERVAVALTVSPILLDGKPIGAIEIFRDITEEVKLDKAKSEFIYIASHQLRTPATGIKQYLSLLLDGYAGEMPANQRRFLGMANDYNDRQLHIIDDLLKVAAADSGRLVLRKEKSDIVAMLNEVIREQSSIFEKHNQIVSYAHSKPAIHARIDRNAMRMVFENLINNAHKYTYPAKKIAIHVEQVGQEVHIIVRDEGVGMDESDIQKLFQKFSRIDNPLSISAGGTGLGLYWAKKIIDLHDGGIEVTSKLNEGTTFTVKIKV